MRVLPHGGAQRGQPDGYNGGRGGEDDGELSWYCNHFTPAMSCDPDGGEGGGGGGGGTHLGTVHGQLLQVI